MGTRFNDVILCVSQLIIGNYTCVIPIYAFIIHTHMCIIMTCCMGEQQVQTNHIVQEQ